MPDFQLPLSIQHNMPHPADFWPPNFSLHPSFNPNLLHQNIMPPQYKNPNFYAFLTQYMGLNNLGLFGYPQNLSMARITPPPNSPRDSPTYTEADK